MYKNGLGIDNLQQLMYHKTKPNQKLIPAQKHIAQSAGAVEYTDCFFAEE